MTHYFAHPSGNGYVESVGGWEAFGGAFFFGWLYFAVKRAWAAAFVAVVLNALTLIAAIIVAAESEFGAGIMIWIVARAFLCYLLIDEPVANAYRRRGWNEVLQLTEEAPAANDGETTGMARHAIMRKGPRP